MSKKYDHPLMRKSAAAASSGIAFFGSETSDFHMIIRCPIHVYCVLKKACNVFERPIKSSFYAGSMPITDLALSKFIGNFLYVSPTGKKAKYQAAFIYPVNEHSLTQDLLDSFKLCQVFDNNKWSYYEKETNRELRSIIMQDSAFPLLPDLEFV